MRSKKEQEEGIIRVEKMQKGLDELIKRNAQPQPNLNPL